MEKFKIFSIVFAFIPQVFCDRIKPNAVVFLVDDMGYADLGCFGNDSLKTPNIDRLAAEGAKLTHNLSPESICTPSRAAFLTGRYAVRSGMAPSAPGSPQLRVYLHSSSSGGLPTSERTFAKELSEVGYRTGMIGKWHLGLNCKTRSDFCHHPLNHGFDFFYGMPVTNLRNCGNDGEVVYDLVYPNWRKWLVALRVTSAILATSAYMLGIIAKRSLIILLLLSILIPVVLYQAVFFVLKNLVCVLIRNREVVEQPYNLQNLTVRFTAEAINFIEENKNKPFLLFLSFAKVHTALFTTKAFEDHSGHSQYGDNIEEMDWSVGKVMSTLERLGLRNDTFVYLTSDQGPHIEEINLLGEYQGGWKGHFKGGKANTWEGGIRVPTVVSWPSRLPKGIEISEPTNSFDIFPTLLEIAGADLPKDRVIDGKTLIPLLTQQTNITSHEIMIHYCAKAIHAVRYRPRKGKEVWKAHFVTAKFTPGTESCIGRGLCHCFGNAVSVHDPPLLFDLTEDPSEKYPIPPDDPRYKPVIDVIEKAVKEHSQKVEEVPCQMAKDHIFPRFQLQVCCNPPWCNCKENVTIPQELWP